MAGPAESLIDELHDSLIDELQAPQKLRRFGSGWYSGFFGLLMAISGFALVLVLRYPDWLGSPEALAVGRAGRIAAESLSRSAADQAKEIAFDATLGVVRGLSAIYAATGGTDGGECCGSVKIVRTTS